MLDQSLAGHPHKCGNRSAISLPEVLMAFPKNFTELIGVRLPIIQAPMAGSSDAELVIAVSESGGLGSLPCAMLNAAKVRSAYRHIRQRTTQPVNLNFFCHRVPLVDHERERRWRELLASYYTELGIDPSAPLALPNRKPFDEAMCDVSQGLEAGGHRGMFLAKDVACQVGTIALTPQIVDAVKVPVIAAGGIADARGIVAAFALGASAVQIGTAYLLCPESRTSAVHRKALDEVREDQTVLTNVITGRPARGIVNRVIRDLGPTNPLVPELPRAADGLAPLRVKAEQQGSGDFSPLWAGQSAAMCRQVPAGELTKRLAAEALALMKRLGAEL